MVLVLCLRAIFPPIYLRGHNGSSGERLNDVNDEFSDHADASRHAGGSGSQERAAPPSGGGGDDSCRQNDRNAEARERAIMNALDLIEDSNEILQLADGHPGVRLVGQSKEEARRAEQRESVQDGISGVEDP